MDDQISSSPPQANQEKPAQFILVGIVILIFLLAALAFYLLQDPTAPLPFTPPSLTPTRTLRPPTATLTWTPTHTSTPTRRPSYTPRSLITETVTGSPQASDTATQAPTPTHSITPSPLPAASTPTATSTSPPRTLTPTRPPATSTPSPTTTPTLAAGEYVVTGRILQNGIPVSGVSITIDDGTPSRTATTNGEGRYRFITTQPGLSFTLFFDQSINPQLTPANQVASYAEINGYLPTGVTIIELPDLEVSLNLGGLMFEPLTPAGSATYSAAAITPANPIQFTWSAYPDTGAYYAFLRVNGSQVFPWISYPITGLNVMFDGTLTNGTHITAGTYWWSIDAVRTVGNYYIEIYTQERSIVFNP